MEPNLSTYLKNLTLKFNNKSEILEVVYRFYKNFNRFDYLYKIDLIK